MTKKTLLLLIAFTVLLTIVTGCGTQDTTTTSVVVALPKTTTTTTISSTTPWATKTCDANMMAGFSRDKSLTLSGKFQGVAVSDIAKNYLALSGSKADAVTAVLADGQKLVVAYVSCDGATGQDVNGVTPDKGFSLDGTVVHLVAFTGPDATTGHYLTHLPSFTGSNFGAIFLPIGFIAATAQVLARGEIYDMGAGGSCATTYWKTIDVNTAATTAFSTDPTLLVYPYNRQIVYVSPNPCMEPPQSIHVKDVTTGSDQLVKQFKSETFVDLTSIEVKEPGGTQTQFVLHYATRNAAGKSTPTTLVLP